MKLLDFIVLNWDFEEDMVEDSIMCSATKVNGETIRDPGHTVASGDKIKYWDMECEVP